MMNEKNIWSEKQNHPELVIQDAKEEFNLTEEQTIKLRKILIRRGINKWLYCRIKFIQLKHEIKEMMKSQIDKDKKKLLEYINAKMQNIAKIPRYVLWGVNIHRKMKNNLKEIEVLGRHC